VASHLHTEEVVDGVEEQLVAMTLGKEREEN
jgi:hypothetical protein